MQEMLTVAERIRAIMRDQGRDQGRNQVRGASRVGLSRSSLSRSAFIMTRCAVPLTRPARSPQISRPTTKAQHAMQAGDGEDLPGSWYAHGMSGGAGAAGGGGGGGGRVSRALCRDNARVVLTAAIQTGHMVVSRDPSDKAHLVMDRADRLLPATEVPNATPRQYPESCCTAGGVPFDSMFDELHERQMRLVGVRGLEYESQAAINERMMVRAAGLVGDDGDALRLRDILRPRTRRAKEASRSRDRRDACPTSVGRNAVKKTSTTSARTGAESTPANDRAATGRDRGRA